MTTPPNDLTSPPSRKTVTVLFCDLTGWTGTAERLDPEPLHTVLARYQDVAKDVVERHGGTIEKFIGDAVMAVFGVPVLHEDDALRAVRAAAELGPSLALLNEELDRDWGLQLGTKIAVNTGEVVAGEDSFGNPRLAGDTLNVAARLEEEVAGRGDVILGEETYRIVRQAVLAEPLRAVSVSGREGAVQAWRLLELRDDVPAIARAPSSRFVGRRRELAQLEQALAWADAERTCVLCTVIGPPGIGKSRLAREFIASQSADVRLAAGRCLSYGEAITYWPLREIVASLAGDDPREWIKERLGSDASAVAIAERVAAAIGVGEAAAPRDETFWAFRKLFEALAADQPLVLVLDDIHWAERTLLELLEQLVNLSAGAPLFIVCLARPELYESYPEWAIPHPNRPVFSLPPLSKRESEGLVGGLELAHELAEPTLVRAVQTAEGNPLYLEQLVAFESEGASAELPPSIDALLAARIERLEPAERAVLTRAAIEGRNFHRAAVETLLPPDERAKLDERLLVLVRKDFIEPYRSQLERGEAYRFRHILLRDAAYDANSKRSRAELHERYADWLEQGQGEDERVGYHLEQASRYHAEVSPADSRRIDLALRGAKRLGSAGRAALNRGDVVSAVNLLSRAIELPPLDAPIRLELLPDLADALSSVGAPDRAQLAVSEAIELASAAGDAHTRERAQLQKLWLRFQADPTTDIAEILREARAAAGVFEQAQDDRALAHAWHLIAWVQTNYGKLSELGEVVERAVAHARAAGDAMTEEDVIVLQLLTGPTGPLPVAEVIPSAETALERARRTGSRRVEMASLVTLAMCAAFQKEFDRARALISEAKSIDEDLGGGRATGFQYWPAGLVELLAGDAEQAERLLRDGYETLRRRGDNWWMCGVAAELADALWLQGRDDEALELTQISRQTTPKDDPVGEMMWRGAQAKILARRGSVSEAEALAREALAIIEQTDYVLYHADALTDLAEVLRVANRADEAAEVAARAALIYEQKGNVAAAEAARRLLDDLPTQPVTAG